MKINSTEYYRRPHIFVLVNESNILNYPVTMETQLILMKILPGVNILVFLGYELNKTINIFNHVTVCEII